MALPLNQRSYCIYCVMPSAYLRLDRKGKPYYSCEACATRSFLRSQDALNGVLWLMARSKTWVAERMKERMHAMEVGEMDQALPVAQAAAGVQEVKHDA